jgi:hypothetical protein
VRKYQLLVQKKMARLRRMICRGDDLDADQLEKLTRFTSAEIRVFLDTCGEKLNQIVARRFQDILNSRIEAEKKKLRKQERKKRSRLRKKKKVDHSSHRAGQSRGVWAKFRESGSWFGYRN